MKNAIKAFRRHREEIDDLDAIDPELITRMYGIYDEMEKQQFMALVSIVKNDSWMENVLYFDDLLQVLNGIESSLFELEGVTVPQLWYAFVILGMLRNDIELCGLCQEYVKYLSAEEGFLIYPPESGITSEIPALLKDIVSTAKTFSTGNDFDPKDRLAVKVVEIVEYIQKKMIEDEL